MKSKYIILSLFAVALFGSCSDFLNEDPQTSLSAEAIYSNKEGVEAAMVGCYSAMSSSSSWMGLMFEGTNNISGLFSYKGSPGGEQVYYPQLTFDAVSATNRDIFSQQYVTVNRANDVIDNIKKSPMPEQYRQEIEGEARFVRAFTYFTIVRLWGRAPLFTVPPRSIDDAVKPFSEINEIYKLILEDLEFAENNMRAPYSNPTASRTAQISKARPNYWAATALKAKVYAQIGCIIDNPDAPFTAAQADFTNCGIADRTEAWTKALTEGQKVEAGGPYQLLPKYGDLFDWGNHTVTANNIESIFELQSTPLSGGGYTTLRSSPNFWGAFTTIADNTSWGRVRPTREMFLRHWANPKYRDGVMTDVNGVVNGGSLDRDPRIDAAYLHTQYTVASNAPASEKPTNPAWGSTMYVFPALNGDKMSGTAEATWYGNKFGFAPYTKKYFDPTFTGSSKTNANMYLYRYADLILVMAEAAAELGDNATAVAYVNKVLDRARNSKSPASAYPLDWNVADFADSQTLVYEIMYERQRELMSEGQDNFDTKRKGFEFFTKCIAGPHNNYLNRVNDYPYLGQPNLATWTRVLATPRQVFGNTKYNDKASNYGDNNNIPFPTTSTPEEMKSLKKIMLLAVPQNELDRNKAATPADQNYGY